MQTTPLTDDEVAAYSGLNLFGINDFTPIKIASGK